MNAPRFSAKVGTLPRREHYAISRVYPRLTVGGAESDILVLLQGIGDTQMIVTEIEGPAAQVARTCAKFYRHLEAPRFFNLWTALQSSPLVHLHTINDHPLAPLAAQFCDAGTIVQTVHNDFDAESSHLVDHSIVVDPETKWRLAAPSRSCAISSGINVPKELPPLEPLKTPARPIRLLEIRRPDKPMALTLEQIVATQELQGIAWTATVVGVDPPVNGALDSRIKYVGAVADVDTYLRNADILVHASSVETFGRAVFEALAFGVSVFTTPLPPFELAERRGAEMFLMTTVNPVGAARELRTVMSGLNDEAKCATRRARNHAFVKEHHSAEAMVLQTNNVYSHLQSKPHPPRNFTKADVTDGDSVLFCATLDALLERRTPPSIHSGILSARQQAVVTWLGVRFGVVRQSVAVPLLEHAASVLGPRHLLCVDLANAHAALGSLPQALAWSLRAVEIDPQKVGAFIACALIYIATGQRARADDFLSRIESAWPGHPAIAAIKQKLAPA